MNREATWNDIMDLVLYIETGTTDVDRDCWPLKDLLRRLHEFDDKNLKSRPAAWEHPETRVQEGQP